MESILNNSIRIGNFTSSEIVALTTKGTKADTLGKPAITYIQKKNMERRHGLPLSSESDARPLTWGKLLEPRCFDLLGIEYKLCSSETIQHPEIYCWAGSPDAIKYGDEGITVVDIKCPMTRQSFSELVDVTYGGLTGMDLMDHIRNNQKDGEKYYWQLVSNAILTGAKYAELIVYMPHYSELPIIKEMAQNSDDLRQYRYYWISNAEFEDLPHIRDNGYYRNLNIIRFEVPQSDKDFLTECVMKAESYLIERP